MFLIPVYSFIIIHFIFEFVKKIVARAELFSGYHGFRINVLNKLVNEGCHLNSVDIHIAGDGKQAHVGCFYQYSDKSKQYALHQHFTYENIT